jgi:hypothetical protein
MRIRWEVSDAEIDRVKVFFAGQAARPFVCKRIDKNVLGPTPQITPELVWRVAVACLLTTQQRSGPGTAISRFISLEPNPLSLDACRRAKAVAAFVAQTLTDSGGIRRTGVIGAELAHNLAWLDERDGWAKLEEAVAALGECRARNPREADIGVERRAALVVHDNLKGFGPKQSRNLWQGLGLTRYEIPADSRVSKWLREYGFPLEVSANSLGDLAVYLLIMDGFQALCRKVGVLPCVLDAAIFASFDKKDWGDGEVFW